MDAEEMVLLAGLVGACSLAIGPAGVLVAILAYLALRLWYGQL